ncbi:MAG TPA: zinc ribbon domain-containing protein [Ktedonobacterales bacterium]|nr:zinc ribbon domain-containing protein [Ktedonobacterales bacterium]
MGAAPEWQANYVDLCDDRTLNFGAECVVCQARYVSATVPLLTAMPYDGAPGAEDARAISDQKLRVFTEFDHDYRSILLACTRCGALSCPDCWDVDRQLCGACVADMGLMRSPPLGGPAQGPLAAGTLRRSAAGRYSEVGRPAWLKELLSTQGVPGDTDGPAPAAASAGPAESGGDLRVFLDPVEATYPLVAPLPTEQVGFEPPPTDKFPVSAEPDPFPITLGTERLVAPEGQATADVSVCPRCGTPNYDFVTQCANCGLQLIQICPECQHLNPADAQICQFCEMPLHRPTGWTSVTRSIEPMNPEEGRRRMTERPAPAAAVPRPQVRQRASWSDELVAEAPQATPPAPPRRERRSFGPRREQRAAAAVLAPAPAPMEVAPISYASPVYTPHPYETSGAHELMPIIGDPGRQANAQQAQIIIGDIVALVERVMVIALLLGLFVVVGLVTAAETSSQANLALRGVLHFDVKSHVDQLLNALHILQSPR